jgi:hypothetical protein
MENDNKRNYNQDDSNSQYQQSQGSDVKQAHNSESQNLGQQADGGSQNDVIQLGSSDDDSTIGNDDNSAGNDDNSAGSTYNTAGNQGGDNSAGELGANENRSKSGGRSADDSNSNDDSRTPGL